MKEEWGVYLQKSNALLGLLGECYAEGYFQKQNYAYVTLEQIFKSKKYNKIEFKFNSKRILVNIPKKIQEEIKKLSTPYNLFEPHYVYDFLICKIKSEHTRYVKTLDANDFLWVEAKSGNSPVSQNQIRAKSETQISVMICRAEGVYENLPINVRIGFSEL